MADLFDFRKVEIFDEKELNYSETMRWLKSQVESVRDDWTGSCRPSSVDLFNVVDEIIDDEILACEKANGNETDIDFFLKCKMDLKFIRVRTLLRARYGDGYVTCISHKYSTNEYLFSIDKHYESVWSGLMEELYEIVGFNFSVKIKYGGLAIIVKII